MLYRKSSSFIIDCFCFCLCSSTITRETFDLRMVGYVPHIQADGLFKGRFQTALATINSKAVFNLSLSGYSQQFSYRKISICHCFFCIFVQLKIRPTFEFMAILLNATANVICWSLDLWCVQQKRKILSCSLADCLAMNELV